MIEFGPSRCAGRIVTVAHLCMERMLRRAGRADRRTHTKTRGVAAYQRLQRDGGCRSAKWRGS
ncbi:hypothetical protein NKJ71_31405 [Mesorhizobium sp. M0050]